MPLHPARAGGARSYRPAPPGASPKKPRTTSRTCGASRRCQVAAPGPSAPAPPGVPSRIGFAVGSPRLTPRRTDGCGAFAPGGSRCGREARRVALGLAGVLELRVAATAVDAAGAGLPVAVLRAPTGRLAGALSTRARVLLLRLPLAQGAGALGLRERIRLGIGREQLLELGEVLAADHAALRELLEPFARRRTEGLGEGLERLSRRRGGARRRWRRPGPWPPRPPC